jgi:hypothetical protein
MDNERHSRSTADPVGSSFMRGEDADAGNRSQVFRFAFAVPAAYGQAG